MVRSGISSAFGVIALATLATAWQGFSARVMAQEAAPQPTAEDVIASPLPSPAANQGSSAVRRSTPDIDQGYVRDARISSIIPAYLRANERVVVNVDILIERAMSSATLAERMRILIDGVEVEPLPFPMGGAAKSGAAPLDASENTTAAQATTNSAQPREISLTLFGRVPSNLSATSKPVVSVYSGLDRRIIASVAAEAPPDRTIASETLPPATRTFWNTYGWLLAISLAFAIVVGGYTLRMRERAAHEQMMKSQQEIKRLEATVQSTRNALGAVTGEAPRHIASPGLEVPPVKMIDVPEAIFEALERGELGMIVGAAASVHANLPVGASLWLGAIERLNEYVTDAQRIQLQKLIAESGSDAVVEPLLSLVGRERVLKALDAELSMDRASPRSFHRHLAALAPLGAHRYVDLSWDGVLESVLKGIQARIFSTRNFTGLSEALRGAQVTLIKPYGEIREPGGVSLTAQDFRRQLAESPEFERCLASLFSAQTLVFVGMSTKAIEQFLSVLPPQLEFSGREHFALVPLDWTLELWSQGFAKRYGVTVLPLGADDSAESATEVLGFIVKKAQERRARSAPTQGKVGDFKGIGTLRSLRLQNIGNFTSIELDFHERWNLLLGDNGGGKSTILRAITLALSGTDTRCDAMAARLLRNGENSGAIELSFGSGATRIRTGLVRDDTRVKINAAQVTPLQGGQCLVLGFPALRGVTTIQQTGVKPLAARDPNVDDVAPLLQERVDTRLNQLKQWVINTAVQAEKAPNGREAQMFKTFRRVLRDVVPGRHVDFEGLDPNWTVLLRTDDGIVSFDWLSQGTSSILGWIGVLLQRLYDIYPNAEKPEDGPALLLIDEIDAHLHPRWQRKLVTLTREQFPQVQIIASSHSPLLAGAMRREELRIVERDPATGQMRASMPQEDLQGQTADQILTSSLFALSSTRSPEAEGKIERYFSLYEKHERTALEDQELRELEGSLDQINYGSDRLMRETQHALEQQIKTQLDSITPEMAVAISGRMGAAGSQKEHEL